MYLFTTSNRGIPRASEANYCIEQFALTEASYTTIRLMQEFKTLESRDYGPWEELLTLTCASRNGTQVALTPA